MLRCLYKVKITSYVFIFLVVSVEIIKVLFEPQLVKCEEQIITVDCLSLIVLAFITGSVQFMIAMMITQK